MSSKTLLVLSASYYQLDAIRAARRLGYRVLTADNRPENLGHKLADQAFSIDTTDKDSILALAKGERIDGVIAPATDVAVPTVAYVSEQLGLPGPSQFCASLLTNKLRFRQFLRDEKLPCPRFVALPCGTAEEIPWLDEVRGVLKPLHSSGAKGVFIVCTQEELVEKLPETLQFSANDEALVEEYLPGSQGSVSGVMQQGVAQLAFFFDRHVWTPPYATTRGHRIPSNLLESQRKTIVQQIEAIFRRCEYLEGPFDCDFVIDGSRAYILEISPRLGGNSIARLVQSAYGFDFCQYVVQFGLHEPLTLPSNLAEHAHALELLGVRQDGILHYREEELARLQEEPWLIHLTVDFAPGQSVSAFINSRNRLGEALVSGSSRQDVDSRMQEVLTRLDLQASS